MKKDKPPNDNDLFKQAMQDVNPITDCKKKNFKEKPSPAKHSPEPAKQKKKYSIFCASSGN